MRLLLPVPTAAVFHFDNSNHIVAIEGTGNHRDRS